MSVWKVTTPDGRQFRVEGDTPPTDADLDKELAQPQQPTGEESDAAATLRLGPLAPGFSAAGVNAPSYLTAESAGSRLGRELSESAPVRWVNKPFINLTPPAEAARSLLTLPWQLARERIETTPDEVQTPIAEKLMAMEPSDKTLDVGTGAVQAVGDMASFFTSPLGITTLGTGALPKVAQRVIALAFASQMASELPDTAKALHEELTKPEGERDYTKIGKLATGGAASTVLATVAAKHGLTEPVKGAPNAIPERISETVPVGETPRGSAEVGTGVPEPEKVAAAQKPVTPETPTNLPTKELKPADPNWQVTVQQPTPVGDKVAPGYVQIDDVSGGENKWSSNPEKLRQQGFDVPDFSQLPAGKYKLSEAAAKLRELVTTAESGKLPKGEPAQAPIPAGTDITTGALGEVGMGAAKEGEIVDRGDPMVTGLAERVRKQREESGHTAPTEPGAGIAPEASVERGRQLLPTADPEKVMADFEKSNRMSSDDVAIVRARAEQLAKQTNLVEQAFGTDSPEFREAFKRESAWAERTKRMQTEWAKSGHAQQGEVDIDTGTFTGLARAFRELTGTLFNPKQAETAKRKAGKVKAADSVADAAKIALYDQLETLRMTPAERRAWDAANRVIRNWAVTLARLENKQRIVDLVRDRDVAKIQEDAAKRAQAAADTVKRNWAVTQAKQEIQARIDRAAKEKAQYQAEAKEAKKKLLEAQQQIREAAVKAARDEVKENVLKADTPAWVWKHAKEYIEKGMDDFNDIRNKLATDLGMTVDKVTAALAKDKRVKYLADDLWRKQQTARELKTQAKIWLRRITIPGYQRYLENVPRVMFGLKVGFHGTVALGTHAPLVPFQPRYWKAYVTDFAKMYRMVGSKAYYEMQMQDLIRRTNYTRARRAGLVNDPFTYEDFNSPATAKYFSKLNGPGNRGYSVLKILRQDMFDQQWDKLPKTMQRDEIAHSIAVGVNHSTGVVAGQAPAGTHVMLFAPRLEASRVAWLAVDPAKAVATFANWKNATDGEKMFAINQVKEKAWVAGTLFSLLALNQGFLSAIGSEQEVNFTDPMKSDFLKFKVAGMSFSYGNAMISMARLPVRLYAIRASTGGKMSALVHPDESSYTVLGEYARSQLSPFASLASSLWLKADWQNRPLPSSNRPVPKRLEAQGVKPYTWSEFWTEQALPIPAEEAAREVWKNGMGMSDEQVRSMFKAMATITVMGATGGRLVEDTQPKTVYGLMDKFKKTGPPEPDYNSLRAALEKDDLKGASRAYAELLKSKKPVEIERVMRPYTVAPMAGAPGYYERHDKPFTGSVKTERKFVQSLDQEGKAIYDHAKRERLDQYEKFKAMVNSR